MDIFTKHFEIIKRIKFSRFNPLIRGLDKASEFINERHILLKRYYIFYLKFVMNVFWEGLSSMLPVLKGEVNSL